MLPAAPRLSILVPVYNNQATIDPLSDLVQVRSDVSRGGTGVTPTIVSGVGPRDRVAEVAFHPGQGRVTEPVGADLLGGYPRQVLAEAQPEVVVAAGGDRLPGPVTQHLVPRPTGTAALRVITQVMHQRGGNGLPPYSFALLP